MLKLLSIPVFDSVKIFWEIKLPCIFQHAVFWMFLMVFPGGYSTLLELCFVPEEHLFVPIAVEFPCHRRRKWWTIPLPFLFDHFLQPAFQHIRTNLLIASRFLDDQTRILQLPYRNLPRLWEVAKWSNENGIMQRRTFIHNMTPTCIGNKKHRFRCSKIL